MYKVRRRSGRVLSAGVSREGNELEVFLRRRRAPSNEQLSTQ
jgi:hypothetical protein